MQTFLPYASFSESAKVLDMRRLGKQRVEVLQILKALHGESKGWTNHPITKAWQGREDLLIVYGVNICSVWSSRGYKDTCKAKITSYLNTSTRMNLIKWLKFAEMARLNSPPWLGNPQLHSSYRALLLHKDPIHYGQFGWSEAPIEKLDYSLFQV